MWSDPNSTVLYIVCMMMVVFFWFLFTYMHCTIYFILLLKLFLLLSFEIREILFTELALWADSVTKLQCPPAMCVSVCVTGCAIAETPLVGGLDSSGQGEYC